MLIKTKLKLIISFAVVMLILIGSIEYLHHLKTSEGLRSKQLVTQLAQGIYDINFLTYEYLKDRTPRSTQQWYVQYTNLSTSLDRAKVSLSEEQNIIKGMEHNVNTLETLFQKLEDNNKIAESGAEELRDEINNRLTAQLLISSRALYAKSVQLSNIIRISYHSFQRQKLYLRTTIFSLFTITLILLMIFLGRSIFPRLKKLDKAFKQIATGNLGHRVYSSADDELGAIYAAFNETVTRLDNITVSRKDLEHEIKEKELSQHSLEQVSAALDQSNDAVFMYNRNSQKISYTNKGAERILGYSKEEFLSKTTADLLGKSSGGKGQTSLLTPPGENPLAIIEMEFIHKTGRGIFMELSSQFVKDDAAGGNAILIGRDISDRKAAENDLLRLKDELEEKVKMRTQELQDRINESEQLNKAMVNLLEDLQDNQNQLETTAKQLTASNSELKEFAYIVSHDLKAPLRAISQLTHWISSDYSDAFDDEGRMQMDLILQRVKRMDGLIDGILRYSRVGRVRGKVERLDLNILVDEIIESIVPPEIIHVAIESKLPVVYLDSIRVGQVFQNLIENAIKYMDKDRGAINVGCADEGAFWEFSVSDNGPGIDKKYHDKIFQIFQTLAPRDEHESTGIGLSLVKKIIGLYGGSVWLESESGCGTTFFFTLPKKGEDDEEY